ncbi:MAG: hypothetical protein AMXMBFR64_11890 [Myxococcales bacterium]
MGVRENLFRQDDILIRVGWATCVLSVFWVLGSMEKPAAAPFAVLFALAPVGLLTLGYRVRAREKRCVAIWRILDRAKEVRVRDLLQSTGFSREDVAETLRAVNGRGLAWFVWDTDTDMIVDGRLRSEMVLVESCPSCGARVSQRVPLGASQSPVCSHCGAAFSSATLNELRLKALAELRNPPPGPGAPAPAGGRTFNPVVFMVLAVVFWPAAVVYYVRNRPA